jgi:hypothetical protein
MACGQSDPALAAANSEIHLVAEHIRGNWSRFAFDGANTCTHHQHLGKYVLSLCINSTWRAFRWHAKTGVVISGPFAMWRRTARMRACEFLTLTRRPNKGLQTMSNEPFGIGAAWRPVCMCSAGPFPILGGTGTLICIRRIVCQLGRRGSKRCVDGQINCAIIFTEMLYA